jgi:adenylate kinase family enzyme
LRIQSITGKHSVVLLAPNGGGKKRVAQVIAASYGHEHIEPGEMLRADPRFKEIVAKGSLEASRETTELVKNKFFAVGVDKNFTWDGYPRDLDQCEILLDLLRGAKHEYAVVHILIDRRKAKRQALEGDGRGNRGDEAAIDDRHRIYYENIDAILTFWRDKAGARYYGVDNNGTVDQLIYQVNLVLATEAKQVSKGFYVTVGERFSVVKV